jgi:hypothetical protein
MINGKLMQDASPRPNDDAAQPAIRPAVHAARVIPGLKTVVLFGGHSRLVNETKQRRVHRLGSLMVSA